MEKKNSANSSRRKFLVTGGMVALLSITGCTDNNKNGDGNENNNENQEPLQGDELFVGTPLNINPLEIQVGPDDFGSEMLYQQEPAVIKPSDSPRSVSGDFIASRVVLTTPAYFSSLVTTLYTCDTKETAIELQSQIDQQINDSYEINLTERIDVGDHGVMYGSDNAVDDTGISEGILRIQNIVCNQSYIEEDVPTRTLARRLEEELRKTVERIEMKGK